MGFDRFHDLPLGYLVGFSFVLGTAVGSFLNVVVHRVPAGESIVRPRSRCPACSWSIPAWANIPVLSYLLLRGSCHSCGVRISPRYVVIELLTGALFAGLVVFGSTGLRIVPELGLASALIAVAFIDAEHQIIPNSITYPGILLGLLCAATLPPPGWLDALLGVVMVGGMMWGVSAAYEWRTGRIGLGMGDVKLVAMLGGFLGLQGALGSLVIGSFAGLAHGLVAMALFGTGRLTRIPFGPALAAAGILHLFVPDVLPRLLAAL